MNKRYHSGWMWAGVIIGLAIIEFSGSPMLYGIFKTIRDRIVIIIRVVKMSLLVKYGWN